jgi:rhodanese-related sulfurtransferase
MQKIALFFVAFVIMASCSKQEKFENVDAMVEQAMQNVKVMNPDSLHSLMEEYAEYTLIDVRQELEYYHGFIPGAVNIPRGSIEFSIADSTFWDNAGLYLPAKDSKIILYCLKGQRSALTAESIQKLGYQNVYILEGGYKKWELSYPELFEKDLDKLSGQNDKPAKSGSC